MSLKKFVLAVFIFLFAVNNKVYCYDCDITSDATWDDNTPLIYPITNVYVHNNCTLTIYKNHIVCSELNIYDGGKVVIKYNPLTDAIGTLQVQGDININSGGQLEVWTFDTYGTPQNGLKAQSLTINSGSLKILENQIPNTGGSCLISGNVELNGLNSFIQNDGGFSYLTGGLTVNGIMNIENYSNFNNYGNVALSNVTTSTGGYIENHWRLYLSGYITLNNNTQFIGNGTLNEIYLRDFNAKIIIECGAKMSLDNSFLTKGEIIGECTPNQSIGGIIVRGNPSVNQEIQPNLNQGLLKMNNTKIEKCKVGVYVFGGGIVRASNCIFQDNHDACVKFEPYSYQNKSFFLNCDFSVSDKAYNPSSVPECQMLDYGFIYLVDLEYVNNINFYSCNFTNLAVGEPGLASQLYNGYGIYASNSSFSVQKSVEVTATWSPGECVPAPNGQDYKFEHLYYGIYAIDNHSSNKIRIIDGNFNNNLEGIYLEKSDEALIYKNKFKITENNLPFPRSCPITNHFGCSIYSEICNEQEIIENEFLWNYSINPYNYFGIYKVENTCTGISKLYRNIFTIQSSSMSDNRGIIADLSAISSAAQIKFICNEFTNFYEGVHLIDPYFHGIIQQEGLGTSQSTGNKFENITNSTFYDDGYSYLHINYYYDPLILKQNPSPFFPTGFFTSIQTSYSNDCPDFSLCDIYGRVKINTSTLVIYHLVEPLFFLLMFGFSALQMKMIFIIRMLLMNLMKSF